MKKLGIEGELAVFTFMVGKKNSSFVRRVFELLWKINTINYCVNTVSPSQRAASSAQHNVNFFSTFSIFYLLLSESMPSFWQFQWFFNSEHFYKINLESDLAFLLMNEIITKWFCEIEGHFLKVIFH